MRISRSIAAEEDSSFLWLQIRRPNITQAATEARHATSCLSKTNVLMTAQVSATTTLKKRMKFRLLGLCFDSWFISNASIVRTEEYHLPELESNIAHQTLPKGTN